MNTSTLLTGWKRRVTLFTLLSVPFMQVLGAPPLAALNLTKSDGLDTTGCVVSGTSLTYTLCYDNLNQVEANDVLLSDQLPPGTEFIPEGNGGQYDQQSHTVTWSIGDLPAGAPESCVTLQVSVPEPPPGPVLTNTARIDSATNGVEASEASRTTDICPIPVYVDIKPGGCPTPINVNSRGVLPVAILGTESFDVETIAPETVTLAGDVRPLRWSLEDVATPYDINPDGCSIDDCHELEGDGHMDLTLKFDSVEVAQAIGEVYDRDCLLLELKGNLRDAHNGLAIQGGDVVSILKKKRVHLSPNSLLLLNSQ